MNNHGMNLDELGVQIGRGDPPLNGTVTRGLTHQWCVLLRDSEAGWIRIDGQKVRNSFRNESSFNSSIRGAAREVINGGRIGVHKDGSNWIVVDRSRFPAAGSEDNGDGFSGGYTETTPSPTGNPPVGRARAGTYSG